MIERYEREMGISYKDFYRLLPIALKNIDYLVQGNCIKFKYCGGDIQIELGIERERKIASLVLPTVNVVFSFTDIVMTDIEEFLFQFDRTYQRGGG